MTASNAGKKNTFRVNSCFSHGVLSLVGDGNGGEEHELTREVGLGAGRVQQARDDAEADDAGLQAVTANILVGAAVGFERCFLAVLGTGWDLYIEFRLFQAWERRVACIACKSTDGKGSDDGEELHFVNWLVMMELVGG
jgi:hypothetical protein